MIILSAVCVCTSYRTSGHCLFRFVGVENRRMSCVMCVWCEIFVALMFVIVIITIIDIEWHAACIFSFFFIFFFIILLCRLSRSLACVECVVCARCRQHSHSSIYDFIISGMCVSDKMLQHIIYTKTITSDSSVSCTSVQCSYGLSTYHGCVHLFLHINKTFSLRS